MPAAPSPDNASVLCFSYSRFSSPEQAKGDSIRRQDAALAAFLTRRGLTLDTTLRFVDAGVSGFKGKHRADDTTALGHFLSLVRSGRVPKDSYLVVESLDRLSREDVSVALELLLGLLNAGVRVVQLYPAEMVYSRGADAVTLVMAIMELSRGNSESAMKSVRVGAAWEEKRKAARTTGKAISASCPAWLRKVGDRYEVIPDRAAVVRRIFELSADGHGTKRIVLRLKDEGVPPFGRRPWNNSYVASILTGREALGEYVPCKSRQKGHDPIPDYYPAVVPEDLYYRSRGGRGQRHRRGRVSAVHINLFAGLLFDAERDEPMVVVQVVGGRGTAPRTRCDPRYRNNSAVHSRGSTTFPVPAFEYGVLSCLREIDPADILRSPAPAGDTAASIAGRLAAVDERLRELEDQLTEGGGDGVGVLARAARTLEAKRAVLEDQLNAARAAEVTNAHTSWGECRTLIDALAAAPDPDAARMRLRSALRRVVRRIDLLVMKNGRREVAVAQFRFHDSEVVRTVFIRHRGAVGGVGGRIPAYTAFSTRTDGVAEDLDIVKHRKVVRALIRPTLEAAYWKQHFEPALLAAEEKAKAKRKAYMRKYCRERYRRTRKGK